MVGPTIVLGPASSWLRESIVRGFGEKAEVVEAQHKVFPDGESYVRIPLDSLDGRRVLIVQSLPEPQDRSIWQLLLLVDAARRLGAEEIGVYAPYFAYSRQDRVFLRGEPVSVEVLLNTLASLGVKWLFTIDVHNPRSLQSFRGRGVNIMAFQPLVELVKPRLKTKPLILAPDKGAVHRAEHVASLLGSEYDYLEKRRDRVTGEISVTPKTMSVEGRSVVIVDDIISTGGTVARAASMLLDQGASQVLVAVSHALMAGSAREKLSTSGVEAVLSLNTLPPRESVLYADATPVAFNHISEFLL